MNKFKSVFLLLISNLYLAQVGINTTSPSGIFHIDSKSNNSSAPTDTELGDDVVFSTEGFLSIGKINPNTDAAIDLSAITGKGILLPSVNLQSSTQQLGTSANSNGVLIYNSGTILEKGYYYWKNNEWVSIDTSTSNAATANIQCNNAIIDPNMTFSGNTIPAGTLMKLNYLNGNGGKYKGIVLTSEGNPNVTATLENGSLEQGSGYLTFKLSGTTTTNQAPPAGITFDLTPLKGLNAGFEGCDQVTVANSSFAEFQQIAVMDFLKPTNDPDDLGYSVEATTPDGLYTFRVFLKTSSQVQLADAQIRNNSTTSKTIMWNNSTMYGGYTGMAGNSLTLPPNAFGGDQNSGNTWYTATNANRIYWGNDGIYQGVNNGPEYRFYSWMEQGSSKTAYIVTFMAGASLGQTSTDYSSMKVYIKIEQIKAP